MDIEKFVAVAGDDVLTNVIAEHFGRGQSAGFEARDGWVFVSRYGKDIGAFGSGFKPVDIFAEIKRMGLFDPSAHDLGLSKVPGLDLASNLLSKRFA